MAKKRVTESLWDAIAPLLPEPKPSPKGGQPPVPNRACLEGIPFVLNSGMPWQKLPTRLGYGSGSTCWRRFRAWTQPGVWPNGTRITTGQEGPAGDGHGLIKISRWIREK